MILLMLFLLSVAIFLATFAFIMYLLTRKQKEQKSKIKLVKAKYLEKLGKLSITSRINEYLNKGGSPNGVTGETLILLHIAAFVLMSIQLINGQSRSMCMSALVILLVDAAVISAVQSHKTKIITELCNIQDIFYFQSKINTPQDIIIAYAARHCNEPLKTPMENLLANYKYRSGKNITDIFDEFRKTSDAMELQSFSFILEQKEINGFSEDNHEAQSIMLKRAKRIRRRSIRQNKRLKLVIASVLLFICYAGFITLPIMKQLLSKWSIIMR